MRNPIILISLLSAGGFNASVQVYAFRAFTGDDVPRDGTVTINTVLYKRQ